MTQDLARPSRRAAFVATGGVLAAGLALAGCGGKTAKPVGVEVSADEGLMRGHAVLRRILVVYRETAGWLAAGRTDFDAGALGQASDLFRAFGEDYLERQLQEQHVFPQLQKTGGPSAGMVPVLLAQHNRGREITALVRVRCEAGKIAAADAGGLARALQDFARMYEAHAAIEDTVVFPAWRQSLTDQEREAVAKQFQQIERSHFDGDAFGLVAGQVAQIEQKLGLADLARFTAVTAPA